MNLQPLVPNQEQVKIQVLHLVSLRSQKATHSLPRLYRCCTEPKELPCIDLRFGPQRPLHGADDAAVHRRSKRYESISAGPRLGYASFYSGRTLTCLGNQPWSCSFPKYLGCSRLGLQRLQISLPVASAPRWQAFPTLGRQRPSNQKRITSGDRSRVLKLGLQAPGPATFRSRTPRLGGFQIMRQLPALRPAAPAAQVHVPDVAPAGSPPQQFSEIRTQRIALPPQTG